MIGTLLTAVRIFTPEQRRRGLWILSLGFVAMLLEMLGTALVVPVLSLTEDTDLLVRYPAIQPWLVRAGNPSAEQLVLAGVTALAVVFLVKNLFLAYYYWEESRFVFGVQASLSHRLFTTYLRQPYTFHLSHNSALLLRNTINEVSNFNTVVGQSTTLVTEGLVLVGMSTLLLVVEPLGAVVVLLTFGATSLLFHLGTRAYLFRWGRARQFHEGLRIKHLQEGLGSIKDVKLLGREDEFLEQYALHNSAATRAAQHHATLKHLPRLWLEILVVAGIAMLVFSLMASGRTVASIIPTIGLFAAAAFRLMPSANRVISAIQALRYGAPVVTLIDHELRLGSAAPAPDASASGPVFRSSIDIRDLSFTYHGSLEPALDGVTLTILRGECIGLIGPSGSGKSTLVDVILGLLDHQAGSIRIDGVDRRDILRAWQDQIGYVPQTIYLTDDSVRRNVAFGVPAGRVDDAAVWQALRAARLDDFVRAQPEGLDAIVGERGVRISGGQRQRIGIARALYHDPSVLVLDEATSALDTSTEHDLMKAVLDMQGTKTILIVAHRLSTVERCDRLYRIEQGRVVDVGTPDDILRRGASRDAVTLRD